MKKILSLALVFCLAFLMVPALAEEDVTGEWYLTEIIMGDESTNPAAFGMDMTMSLAADGSATLTSAVGEESESEAGTWALADNYLTITAESGEPAEFVLEDGLLKSDLGGMVMIFSREAPEALVLPQPVAAAGEEDFLGTWVVTSIGAGDVLMPAATFGLVSQMTIEPGKAVESSGEGDAAVTTEYATEFADGVLKLTSDLGIETVLELNDNGGLSSTLQLDEENALVTYMEKAE